MSIAKHHILSPTNSAGKHTNSRKTKRFFWQCEIKLIQQETRCLLLMCRILLEMKALPNIKGSSIKIMRFIFTWVVFSLFFGKNKYFKKTEISKNVFSNLKGGENLGLSKLMIFRPYL